MFQLLSKQGKLDFYGYTVYKAFKSVVFFNAKIKKNPKSLSLVAVLIRFYDILVFLRRFVCVCFSSMVLFLTTTITCILLNY